MTTSKKNSQKARNTLLVGDSERRKAKWNGFMDWEPTREQKAVIRALEPTAGGISQMLGELAEHGYKVSFSWAESEQVVSVSLYGRFDDMPNGGHVLSLAHLDPIVALTALHWFCGENCAWGPWLVEDYRQAKLDW